MKILQLIHFCLTIPEALGNWIIIKGQTLKQKIGSDPNRNAWLQAKQGVRSHRTGSDPVGIRLPLFRRKKFLIGLFTLIFISLPLTFLSLRNAQKTAAAWFDDSWAFRKAIAIPSHTTAENNVYVSVPAFDATDTTKFQADCGDLRFTKTNGEVLPYFAVDCDATANIHVQFDTLPAGASTYFMYYGNPSAANGFSSADFSTAATGLGTQTLASEEKSQGPAAYWKFDEGTGTNAQDSTQNNNDGTISGATWQNEDMCVSGKCLKFDGSNDRVDLPNDFSKNGSVGTIETWVKFTGSGSAGNISPIVSLGGTASGNFVFVLRRWETSSGCGTNKLELRIYPTIDKDICGSTTLNNNTWYHVVVIGDGSSYKMYVNGNLETITMSTGTNSGQWISSLSFGQTTTTSIGTQYYNGSYFSYTNSFIDEPKIYPYARTAAQIKSDFASKGSGSVKGTAASLGSNSKNSDAFSNGLVGYWKMDEASGNALDSSGNGWTLTNTGPASYIGGKFGNTPNFTGTQYFGNASCTAFSVTDNFSWGGWVYIDSASPASRAILRSEYHHLSTDAAGKYVYYIHDVSWYPFTSTGSYTTNTWQHIFVSYSNRTVKIYINGQLDSTQTHSNGDGLADGTNNCGIGYAGGWNNFVGKIDEVRAYNRALSPKEIRDLYNWAPGPNAYYSFDEGTGTTTYDKSGNGGTGTMYTFSSSAWVQGKYGKALQFDGSSDYIDSTDVSHPYQFTKMAWIKPNTSGCADRCTIINPYFEIVNTNLTFYSYELNPPGWHTASSVITSNEWQHVALSYDDTNLKMFRNGVQVFSVAATRTTAFAASSEIGKISTQRYFDGAIDDLKIYSYARTQKQIVEDMNAGHPVGGSPVGSQAMYLKFDDGYGTTAQDSGPNNIDGTLSGTTWSNSGKFGKAVDFVPASDAMINLGSSSALNEQNGYTIATWIYPDAFNTESYPTILSKAGQSGTTGFIWIYQNSSGNVVWQFADGATYYAKTITCGLVTGSWQHLTLVHDRNNKTFYCYVNGIKKGTTTYTETALTTTTGSAYIGTYQGSSTDSYHLDGKLDEYKIYNSALTADEVKIDYNHGAAMVLGSTSTTSAGAPDNSATGEYCVPGSSDSCAAPVAEWKMDEGTGGSAYDTSGNGNTGSLGVGNSAPTWTTGKIGKSLSFDGTTDKVTFSGISIGTTHTVSMWIFPIPSSDSYGTLLSQNAAIGIWYRGASKKISYYYSSASHENNTALTENQWHHVEVVTSGGNVTFYIDGKSDGTATNAVAYTANNMGDDINSETFKGKIDNLMVYNYARTPAQIAWDYNRGAPVGHWKLDECQGITANDSSGNGNTGTITIGATGTNTSAGTCTGSTGQAWKDGATGKYSSSLEFDGTDDYVNIGETGLDSANITVSSWVKLAADQTSRIFVAKYYESPTRGFGLGIHDSSTNVVKWYTSTDAGSSDTLSSTYALSNGTWYHIVGTFDGTTKKIYINGVLNNSVTWANSIGYTSTVSSIGHLRIANTQRFNGQIDDVRIYNYALTPLQVKTVFNEGSAVRFGPQTGTQ